ncbi:MAG: hypothetical protein EXS05_17755 [Planctomycetaceae bacterium]|nr:hypothetical protein [Planctomycetaceae bacterium]
MQTRCQSKFRQIRRSEALKTSERGRPVFISPGHLVDLPSAVNLAHRLVRGRRLPEPIDEAHRISRTVAANLGRANE